MPKQGKKTTRAQKEAADETCKPAGLTLANFLVLPEKQVIPTENSLNFSEDDSKAAEISIVHQTGTDHNDIVSGMTDLAVSNQNISQVPSFRIKRTKKGNLPITYESRSKGKKVTVISNMSGDLNTLLSELKKATGTGGVAKGEMIELQGDHRKYLEKYLKGHACLY